MPNLILQSVKEKAIAEVAELIEVKTLECFSRGWAFRPTSEAPETFKDLKSKTVGRVIPVADYGCDKTIYKDAGINIKFRFWHDVTHLELDQGFSVAGETSVIESHKKEALDFGLSPLAMQILEADTIGQVLYYDKFKCFVNDQEAWLDSCLQHGIKRALGFKH